MGVAQDAVGAARKFGQIFFTALAKERMPHEAFNDAKQAVLAMTRNGKPHFEIRDPEDAPAVKGMYPWPAGVPVLLSAEAEGGGESLI